MKNKKALFLAGALAVVLLGAVAVSGFGKSHTGSKQEKLQENTLTEEENSSKEQEGIKDPSQESETIDNPFLTESEEAIFELEEEKLKILSIFPSDVPNPDHNFENGTNIASIELKNVSEEYLDSARITLVSDRGQTYEFLIQDLPAGDVVWAFDIESREIGEDEGYGQVTCEASFDPEYENKDFQMEFQNGEIIVTNLTTQDYQNLTIKVRSQLEGVNFGGISYTYKIEELNAKDSTSFPVLEAYFGDAKAVKIERD